MSSKLIVTRETHRLNILRRPRIREKAYCEICRLEVRWLVPDEAMLMANTSAREIFRLVETGECHFFENSDGYLIICADSLTAAGKRTRNPL
jgi:hypothetical protein